MERYGVVDGRRSQRVRIVYVRWLLSWSPSLGFFPFTSLSRFRHG